MPYPSATLCSSSEDGGCSDLQGGYREALPHKTLRGYFQLGADISPDLLGHLLSTDPLELIGNGKDIGQFDSGLSLLTKCVNLIRELLLDFVEDFRRVLFPDG